MSKQYRIMVEGDDSTGVDIVTVGVCEAIEITQDARREGVTVTILDGGDPFADFTALLDE